MKEVKSEDPIVFKKEIKELANLANKILSGRTPYNETKRLIYKSLFSRKLKCFKASIIRTRLIVIDSTYSTNFNKRYYGFDDLLKHLKSYGHSDKEIADNYLNYLINEQSNLFNNKRSFGISKKGDDKGHGFSLISKYGYFLTHFNFPIYDNMAKESLQSIYVLYKNIEKINEKNYFSYIKEINNDFKIKNYDKLDNLLWLLGQIKSGLFKSIILKKNKYQKFVDLLQIEGDYNSKEFTSQLLKKFMNKIRRNHKLTIVKLKNVLSKDILDFVKRANDLNLIS